MQKELIEQFWYELGFWTDTYGWANPPEEEHASFTLALMGYCLDEKSDITLKEWDKLWDRYAKRVKLPFTGEPIICL